MFTFTPGAQWRRARVELTMKKSAIVKLLIIDRGGGCVRALSLVEDAGDSILADGCKALLADLP